MPIEPNVDFAMILRRIILRQADGVRDVSTPAAIFRDGRAMHDRGADVDEIVMMMGQSLVAAGYECRIATMRHAHGIYMFVQAKLDGRWVSMDPARPMGETPDGTLAFVDLVASSDRGTAGP